MWCSDGGWGGERENTRSRTTLCMAALYTKNSLYTPAHPCFNTVPMSAHNLNGSFFPTQINCIKYHLKASNLHMKQAQYVCERDFSAFQCSLLGQTLRQLQEAIGVVAVIGWRLCFEAASGLAVLHATGGSFLASVDVEKIGRTLLRLGANGRRHHC